MDDNDNFEVTGQTQLVKKTSESKPDTGQSHLVRKTSDTKPVKEKTKRSSSGVKYMLS